MGKRDHDGFAVPEVPAKRQRIDPPAPEEYDFSDIDPSLLDEDLDSFLESADDVSDFDTSSLKKV